MPAAVIYDEQPLTFAQSWKQRKRWSTGILQGFSVYFGRLARGIFTEHRIGCFDQMMFFLAPFMQLAYLLSLLLIAVMGILMTALQAIAVLRSGSALAEGFVMMVVGMFVFSLLGPCVLLPLTYRFGSEKARVNFYILIVLVAVLIGTFSGMSTEAHFPFKTVYLVLLAAVIACMPLSYVISCRAYEKREW